MSNRQALSTPLVGHGSGRLTGVVVDAYNCELRDSEGFIGDRASKRAFQAILEDWRERVRRAGEDPLGETPSDELGKKTLDKLLVSGEPEAAGLVQGAIEDFAQEFATVIRRFLRLKSWRDTQRIAVGGGWRASRVGELAIGRTSILLKSDGQSVELKPILYHPDEAGLVGCVHLAPAWIFKGHDSILAVDIGGSNIRAGLISLNLKKSPDLTAISVSQSDLWRYAADKPKRDEAVERLADMLRTLISKASTAGNQLAPFIGIGCPGVIEEDGSIAKGGQNLPGNWETSRFNLPQRLRELIPTIAGYETVVLMHNDAVVQGLSELPLMLDVERWGILTIGTGLGNARFTNRASVE
jgi:hypothetical protein